MALREAVQLDREEQSLLIGSGAIERPPEHHRTRTDTGQLCSVRSLLAGAGLFGLTVGVMAGYSYRGGINSAINGSESQEPSSKVVTIDLLGSQHQTEKHHSSHSSSSHDKEKYSSHDKEEKAEEEEKAVAEELVKKCNDGKYSKRTLKLAYELPFSALFWGNPPGVRNYEASDVILVDEYAYAVCDSSWAIAKFNAQLAPFAADNMPIYTLEDNTTRSASPNNNLDQEDSGYEAIIHENGIFYVVRESIQHDDQLYHAIVEELKIQQDPVGYTIGPQCSTEFEFEGSSKGFEGAIAVYDLNNDLVLLGLCEGNHCSEENKKDRGNGRMVAMRKSVQDDGTCIWATVRIINLPETVDFLDYSAVTISETGRVGITSQEDSKFWVGQLTGKVVLANGDTRWDVDAMEFDLNDGAMYDFPKNDLCMTIYCNIEGIHWINDDMVMAVSDKMKSKGKQDFRCFDKDQSVHVFILPG